MHRHRRPDARFAGAASAGRPGLDFRVPVRRLVLLSLALAARAPCGRAGARLPAGLPLGHRHRRVPDRGRRAAGERRPRSDWWVWSHDADEHRGRSRERRPRRARPRATGACSAATPCWRAAASARTRSASRSSGAACSRAPPRGARTPRQLDRLANQRGRAPLRRASCARSGGRGMSPVLTLNHFTLPTWLHDPIAVRDAFAGVGPDDPPPAVERGGWLDAAHRARVRRVRRLGRLALRPPGRPVGHGQRADGGGGERLRERARGVRRLVPARRVLVPRRGARGAQPRRGERAGLRRRAPPRPPRAGRTGAQHDRLHPLRPRHRARPARRRARGLRLQPRLPERGRPGHRRRRRGRRGRARRAPPRPARPGRLHRGQLLLPQPRDRAARPGQHRRAAVRLPAQQRLLATPRDRPPGRPAPAPAPSSAGRSTRRASATCCAPWGATAGRST